VPDVPLVPEVTPVMVIVIFPDSFKVIFEPLKVIPETLVNVSSPFDMVNDEEKPVIFISLPSKLFKDSV
jgi:hypothetical protein